MPKTEITRTELVWPGKYDEDGSLVPPHRVSHDLQSAASRTSPTCRFYVNDEDAATVEDDIWLAGDVGLRVRGFGDRGVAVQFVNVRVWRER